MNKVESAPLQASGAVVMGGDDSAHDADRWRWCVENDSWPARPIFPSRGAWAVYYGTDTTKVAYGSSPAEAVDRARGVL